MQTSPLQTWSDLQTSLENVLQSHPYAKQHAQSTTEILTDMTRGIITLRHIERVLPLFLAVASEKDYDYTQGNFVPLTMLYACVLLKESQPTESAFQLLLNKFLSRGSPVRDALNAKPYSVQWPCCACIETEFPKLRQSWFGSSEKFNSPMNLFFWMRSSELWIEKRNVTTTETNDTAFDRFEKVFSRHKTYLQYLVDKVGGSTTNEEQLKYLSGAVLELLVKSNTDASTQAPPLISAVLNYLHPDKFDDQNANKHTELLKHNIAQFNTLSQTQVFQGNSPESNNAMFLECKNKCSFSEMSLAARGNGIRQRLSFVRAAAQGAVARSGLWGAAVLSHLRARGLRPLHVAGAASALTLASWYSNGAIDADRRHPGRSHPWSGRLSQSRKKAQKAG